MEMWKIIYHCIVCELRGQTATCNNFLIVTSAENGEGSGYWILSLEAKF